MSAFHRADGQGNDAASRDAYLEVSNQFLERIPGGLFRYRAEGDDTLDYVNTGLLKIFGCDTFEEFCELTGNTFRGIVYPEDWERVDASIYEQVEDGNFDRVIYRIRRKDGQIRWLDDSGHLVEDSEGVRWFYVTVIDITDQVNARQQLEQANDRLEILTALSNDVVFDIQCATGECNVYGDFQGRFGRPPEQSDFVVHRRCQKECNLDISSHDLSHLLEQITDNSLVDFETSAEDAQGNPVWYRYQSVVLYDEAGNPIRHVGRLLDTQEMAMRESQFRKKAERDSLTGIYNRSAALDRIETIMNSETRPCTFVILDVDDFKGVNDTYGHPEGDRVLRELSEFISQVMRKEDIVARLGGDEFAIFAPGLGPGPAMDRILEHLARGPFAADRAVDATDSSEEPEAPKAAPSLSIGAASCLNPPVEFKNLYEVADSALYEAKRAGKAQYRLFIME